MSFIQGFADLCLSGLLHASHPWVEYGRATEGNDVKFTSVDIDCLVINTADILHSALDAVAPLKEGL